MEASMAGDLAVSASIETHEAKSTAAESPIRSVGPVISLPSIPIPNIPIWARILIGGAIVLTIPFYKKFLKIEDAVEKAAEVAAETVEKVAEAVESLASNTAAILPEGSFKSAVLAVEHAAEMIDHQAEVAQAILHKVDEMTDKIEDMVEKEKEAEQVNDNKEVQDAS